MGSSEEVKSEKFHDYQDFIIEERERKLAERRAEEEKKNKPERTVKVKKRESISPEKFLDNIIKLMFQIIRMIFKIAFIILLGFIIIGLTAFFIYFFFGKNPLKSAIFRTVMGL